jgi:hypothetical protein
MVVSVGDREADIYELFHAALSDPQGPKLLVRANRDRLLSEGQGHLWEYVKAQPCSGIHRIAVPRRGKRPAREAELEIRFAAGYAQAACAQAGVGRIDVVGDCRR